MRCTLKGFLPFLCFPALLSNLHFLPVSFSSTLFPSCHGLCASFCTLSSYACSFAPLVSLRGQFIPLVSLNQGLQAFLHSVQGHSSFLPLLCPPFFSVERIFPPPKYLLASYHLPLSPSYFFVMETRVKPCRKSVL